jgi:type IV secretion system protein VirB4
MMNLAEYRNSNTRLADFLPWAALVGAGVVLNKDGSFQRTARFRGPDLDSAVRRTGRRRRPAQQRLPRLGSGWAIFVEAQRHPPRPIRTALSRSASALVDAERKADFEEAGAHFESSYFLTFTYLPPAEDAARAESWLYEGRERRRRSAEVLRGFTDRTDRCCAWSKPSCRNAAGSMTARR